MKIIAWDIGTKNLAFCIIESINNTRKIIAWNKINTKIKVKEKRTKAIEIFLTILQKFKNTILNIDKIVIESQQISKKIMITLQDTLIAFYILNGIEASKIKCIKSTIKFKINPLIIISDITGDRNYNIRKKISVDLTYLCLKQLFDNKGIIFLQNTPDEKRDDLADSFLMALQQTGFTLIS